MQDKMTKKAFVCVSTAKKVKILEEVSNKVLYADLGVKGQSYLAYCRRYKVGGAI